MKDAEQTAQRKPSQNTKQKDTRNMQPFTHYKGLSMEDLLVATKTGDPALHQTLLCCEFVYYEDNKISVEEDEVLLIEVEQVDFREVDLEQFTATEHHVCFDGSESSTKSDILILKSPGGHHVLLHVSTERYLQYNDNGEHYYTEDYSTIHIRIGTEEKIRKKCKEILSSYINEIDNEVFNLIQSTKNIIDYMKIMERANNIAPKRLAELSLINTKLMNALINGMAEAQT